MRVGKDYRIDFDLPTNPLTSSQEFPISEVHSHAHPNGPKDHYGLSCDAGTHMGFLSKAKISGDLPTFSKPGSFHMSTISRNPTTHIATHTMINAQLAGAHMGTIPQPGKSGGLSPFESHMQLHQGDNSSKILDAVDIVKTNPIDCTEHLQQTYHLEPKASTHSSKIVIAEIETSSRVLENINKGTSWASIINQNHMQGFKLSYIKPKDLAQRHIVKVSKAVIVEGSKQWENSFMGYFIGKKLPYSLVKSASA